MDKQLHLSVILQEVLLTEHKESEPTEWRQGAVDMTFYGDENHEYTLPRTEKFLEFRTDNSGKNYWGNVPAGEANWATTDRNQQGGGTGHKI